MAARFLDNLEKNNRCALVIHYQAQGKKWRRVLIHEPERIDLWWSQVCQDPIGYLSERYGSVDEFYSATLYADGDIYYT